MLQHMIGSVTTTERRRPTKNRSSKSHLSPGGQAIRNLHFPDEHRRHVFVCVSAAQGT